MINQTVVVAAAIVGGGVVVVVVVKADSRYLSDVILAARPPCPVHIDSPTSNTYQV